MMINRTKAPQLFWLLVLLSALFLGCGNGEKATQAEPDRAAAKACALELVGDPDANVRSLDFNDQYFVATGEYNDGMNVFAISFTIAPCSQRSISIE